MEILKQCHFIYTDRNSNSWTKKFVIFQISPHDNLRSEHVLNKVFPSQVHVSKAHGKECVENNFSTKKENIESTKVEKTEGIAAKVDNIVKNGTNAKAKKSRSPTTRSKRRSSENNLRESNNADEANNVAVVNPLTPPLSPDGRDGADDILAVTQVIRNAVIEMVTKATEKGQDMNCDEESIEMRGKEKEEVGEEEKEEVTEEEKAKEVKEEKAEEEKEEKAEEVKEEKAEENKENARPKRSKKDNVRLSGYANLEETEVTGKGQAMNCDEESIEIRGAGEEEKAEGAKEEKAEEEKKEKTEEKEEETKEEKEEKAEEKEKEAEKSKEIARPKRSKKDNVRLSGYAQKWSWYDGMVR